MNDTQPFVKFTFADVQGWPESDRTISAADENQSIIVRLASQLIPILRRVKVDGAEQSPSAGVRDQFRKLLFQLTQFFEQIHPSFPGIFYQLLLIKCQMQ